MPRIKRSKTNTTYFMDIPKRKKKEKEEEDEDW